MARPGLPKGHNRCTSPHEPGYFSQTQLFLLHDLLQGMQAMWGAWRPALARGANDLRAFLPHVDGGDERADALGKAVVVI